MMLAYFAALFLASLGVTTTLIETAPTARMSIEQGPDPTAPFTGSSATHRSADEINAEALTSNMLDYTKFAVNALIALPNFKNGTLNQNQLILPSSFASSGWTHFVQYKGPGGLYSGRYVYIYLPKSNATSKEPTYPAGMSVALAKATKGDFFAGQANNGYLYTAGSGLNIKMPLPQNAKIPDGSPLFITVVN